MEKILLHTKIYIKELNMFKIVYEKFSTCIAPFISIKNITHLHVHNKNKNNPCMND